MSSLQLVKSEFQGNEISFTDDGWFNATQAAARFGKRPNDWLSLPATIEYLQALERKYGKITYYKTKRGGDTRKSGNAQGTWFHPKLAVSFSRWLDIDFGVWCDEQIDAILRGNLDQKKARHEVASSFKVMQSALQLVREEQGKVTAAHHYSNEARLINFTQLITAAPGIC